jgi:hypothetical protein
MKCRDHRWLKIRRKWWTQGNNGTGTHQRMRMNIYHLDSWKLSHCNTQQSYAERNMLNIEFHIVKICTGIVKNAWVLVWMVKPTVLNIEQISTFLLFCLNGYIKDWKKALRNSFLRYFNSLERWINVQTFPFRSAMYNRFITVWTAVFPLKDW